MQTRTMSRYRTSSRTPPASIPFVGWSELEAHISRTWTPGEHVALIGKTRSGKTHLGLALADSRPYVIIAATKRHDPLLESAQHGYKVVESMREIPRTESGRPVYRKVIVWPGRAIFAESDRLRLQAASLRETLATAERQRNWTVFLDETMWAYDRLGLKKELDSVWYQGGSAGVSLVACAQRPTRVPRLMISQASHLFLWYISDKRDLEPLRDIAGAVPPEIVEATLPTLDWDRHEFLYVGANTGFVARSIAPAKV